VCVCARAIFFSLPPMTFIQLNYRRKSNCTFLIHITIEAAYSTTFYRIISQLKNEFTELVALSASVP
jgi:gamma-glutamyl:cysteine ligase YbdK (ATP-grasp superfamily)